MKKGRSLGKAICEEGEGFLQEKTTKVLKL